MKTSIKATNNPTNLTSINQKDVDIELDTISEPPVIHLKNLNISSYNFPPDSKVWLLVRGSSTTRDIIDLGNFNKLILGKHVIKGDFSKSIKYRIVVAPSDSRKLIGNYDGTKFTIGLDGEQSIVAVRYVDNLGEIGFRFVIDYDDPPAIELNQRLYSDKSFKEDLRALALLLPEFLRNLARKLVADDNLELEDEGSHYYGFIRIFENLGYIIPLDNSSKEEKENWVNEVVIEFSRRYQFVKKFEESQSSEE